MLFKNRITLSHRQPMLYDEGKAHRYVDSKFEYFRIKN
jgi:hypothetical protein